MGRPKKLAGSAIEAVLTVAQKRELLAELEMIQHESKRRTTVTDPTTYGMPDLLFAQEEGESDEAYRKRQDTALQECVEKYLKFYKDGTYRDVILIDKMLAFIADIFYGRVSMAILWKPRGSGGSLGAAVLIWLVMAYHKRSVVNIAGSGEQSQVVFEYIRGFWDFQADFKANMLATDPTAMKLTFTNGVYFKCLTGSEKQARGKHPSFLVIDECCQRDERTDLALDAAKQTVLSEQDRTVVLVSTFHHPVGFFQEHWDYAESKGFTRYQWTVFDSMAKCDKGLETATEEDPKALEYCKSCPLTRPVEIKDRRGRVVKHEYHGCAGKARDSRGWQTFEQTMEAKRSNIGTTVWENEFECLPAGSRVMTRSGPRPIETITEGELVLTDDGSFRPVIATMSRMFEGDLTALRVRGFQEVLLTPEHPVLCEQRHVTRVRGTRREWGPGPTSYVPARDVKVGDYLKMPQPEVSAVCAAGPFTISRKRQFARGYRTAGWESYDYELDGNEEFAWALGLLFGDGNVSGNTVSLSWRKDQPAIRERYEAWVQSLGCALHENKQVRSSKVLNLRFHDQGIARWLRELLYDVGKKRLPAFIFESRLSLICEFMSGWVAADGEDPSKPVCRLTTVHEDAAYGAVQLFALCGVRATVRREMQAEAAYGSGPVWKVAITGQGKWSGDRFVRSVRSVPFSGRVYNLSVAGNPTYVLPEFAVHNCQRPEYGANIYSMSKIDFAIASCPHGPDGKPGIAWEWESPKAIGLDWGLNQTAIVLVSLEAEHGYAAVLESMLLSGTLIPEVANYLEDLHLRYAVKNASIPVFADSNPPYNNYELARRGFDVQPVEFNRYKEFGIGNVTRFFNLERLRILPDFAALIRQLKSYRRGRDGKPVKKDDHGPDALLCALMAFQFTEVFPDDVYQARGVGTVERNEMVMEF